jgi:hypothetical protein
MIIGGVHLLSHTTSTILIYLPIHTLRCLNTRHIRNRLMSIFAASVLLTIATIVQCGLTFKEPGLKTLQSGLVEVRFSLVGCHSRKSDTIA